MTNDDESYVTAICNTIKNNRAFDPYTYFVDCAKEQGFPNPGYDYFADLLEGTSFKAEDVLKYELKEEDRWLLKQMPCLYIEFRWINQSGS